MTSARTLNAVRIIPFAGLRSASHSDSAAELTKNGVVSSWWDALEVC